MFAKNALQRSFILFYFNNCRNQIYIYKMPELTEITDVPPAKPETGARIEDDDDDAESDTTIPELEDTG